LVEKVEWVRNNRDKAIEIGKAARELFLETSTPEKQIEWISECVSKQFSEEDIAFLKQYE